MGRTSLVLRPCALSANYTASQQRLQSCRELDSMEVARYDPVQGSIGCVSASRHETTGWPADGDPFTAEDVKFSFERYKGANASLRVEAFMYSEGSQSFLQDPEIDAWYERQATERDRTRRETLLHRIQQKVYEEARFLPIWELGFLCASGPRIAVSGLGLIRLFTYSGPYEDLRLKA